MPKPFVALRRHGSLVHPQHEDPLPERISRLQAWTRRRFGPPGRARDNVLRDFGACLLFQGRREGEMHYEGTYLGTMKPAPQQVALAMVLSGFARSRHGRGRLRMPNYVYEASVERYPSCLLPALPPLLPAGRVSKRSETWVPCRVCRSGFREDTLSLAGLVSSRGMMAGDTKGGSWPSFPTAVDQSICGRHCVSKHGT